MRPLEGIRILSVETFGAAPCGTMFLADLGAEVIKVENVHSGGDPARFSGPNFLGEADSQYFQTWHSNKKSILVDLKDATDKADFLNLVETSDAVVNNLRGDQPEKLGLDYAALSKVRPSIVCLHISAYGRDNARADRPGYDFLMQAEAGLMSLTGDPDKAPARFGPSIIDYMTGMTAMTGLLSCLLAAKQTGRGCDVDTSLYEVALHQLGYAGTWYLNEGQVSTRLARSAHFSISPSQTFPAQDGWIFIMCMTDKFWKSLLREIGREDLGDDPRFATPRTRFEHRGPLTEALDAVFRTRTVEAWVGRLGRHLPIGPVHDVAAALDSPFTAEIGMIRHVPHPERSDFRMLANPGAIQSGALKPGNPPIKADGAQRVAAPNLMHERMVSLLNAHPRHCDRINRWNRRGFGWNSQVGRCDRLRSTTRHPHHDPQLDCITLDRTRPIPFASMESGRSRRAVRPPARTGSSFSAPGRRRRSDAVEGAAERPIYQHIVATLRRQIENGDIVVGDMLPSEGRLRSQFAVSRHTVREALRALKDEGLIESRQGAGSRVLASSRPVYTYSINSVAELLQYATEARYEIDNTTAPTPTPVGTQVLVEVSHCGVCHSDLYFQDGFYDLGGGKCLSLADRGVALPARPGPRDGRTRGGVRPRRQERGGGRPSHRLSMGRVRTLQAMHLGQGTHVPRAQTLGVLKSGGYGTHVIAERPEHLIDFGDVDPALAATYACSGITAYSAIQKLMPADPDEPIVVVGAGGLGLAAIRILRALGHEAIVVVDVDAEKGRLAVELGATSLVDGKATDLAAEIGTAAGAPIVGVVDFVAASATANAGVAVLTKGGTYVPVGLYGGDITLSLAVLPLRAISIRGSYIGSLAEMNELIALARSGALRPSPVETVPHAHPNDALDRVRRGEVRGRLVLEVA